MTFRCFLILQLSASWALIILSAVLYGNWTQGRISFAYVITSAATFSCVVISKLCVGRLRRVAGFEVIGAIAVFAAVWLNIQSVISIPSSVYLSLRALFVLSSVICLALSFVLTLRET
jgi:hypothetical protein